ncbi:coiled-coil domain-containing protein SCD2-like protein [Tanacetum coccineum]|uniref:Coiled-coil domain-containing protein SCD2-like protein n=1 Tax=Tanacetum coccineum TaxID=301880 RepID=A0ABQ5BMA1_9ASTR
MKKRNSFNRIGIAYPKRIFEGEISSLKSSQPLINHARKIQSQSACSPFDRTSNSLESFSSNATVEHVQPARANRSSQLAHPVEQPSSARSVSVGRPSVVMKPVTMVPSSVSLSLRPTSSSGQGDRLIIKIIKVLIVDHVYVICFNRLSLDLSAFTFRESNNQLTTSISDPVSELASTSTLQDELRIAEKRCEESEVRAKQLEKQTGLEYYEYCLKGLKLHTGGSSLSPD